MIVKPFRGLRPRADLAHRDPSYPYDVLDTDEARKLAGNDPYSFLHVVRSEIDLPPDADPHGDRVYEKARESFQSMLEQGWLERDPVDSYYVYRLKHGEHVQTGVVGIAAVSDYVGGKIRKHEHTRPDKELDRTRHTEAISAQPGPVFLAYREFPALDAQVEAIVSGPPDVDFTAPDGIAHSLWVVGNPAKTAEIEAAFRDLPATYIADGHHRAASYARVAEARGGGEADHFLAVHFPAQQLRILDYNRVVKDLNGISPTRFFARLRKAGFFLQEGHEHKIAPRPRTFGMYLNAHWYLLLARPESIATTDPVQGLDVSVLTERLLQGVLGIEDPRTDSRIAFVGGIRGMEALEKLVDTGAYAIAFSLHPPTMADVMAVADAGLVMPPKSTWFEPKLRSGMVIHTI